MGENAPCCADTSILQHFINNFGMPDTAGGQESDAGYMEAKVFGQNYRYADRFPSRATGPAGSILE